MARLCLAEIAETIKSHRSRLDHSVFLDAVADFSMAGRKPTHLEFAILVGDNPDSRADVLGARVDLQSQQGQYPGGGRQLCIGHNHQLVLPFPPHTVTPMFCRSIAILRAPQVTVVVPLLCQS